MNIKCKELLGLPVISLTEGQQLGTVQSLLIDSQELTISAIIVSVSTLAKETRSLPYSKVHSVGSHAITVTSVTDLQQRAQPPVSELLNSRLLSGTRVISDQGNSLGMVKDVLIDTATGAIVSLEISGGLMEGLMKRHANLSAEYLQTLGRDVIVAAAAGEEHLSYGDHPMQHLPGKLIDAGTSTKNTVQKYFKKASAFKEKKTPE